MQFRETFAARIGCWSLEIDDVAALGTDLFANLRIVEWNGAELFGIAEKRTLLVPNFAAQNAEIVAAVFAGVAQGLAAFAESGFVIPETLFPRGLWALRTTSGVFACFSSEERWRGLCRADAVDGLLEGALLPEAHREALESVLFDEDFVAQHSAAQRLAELQPAQLLPVIERMAAEESMRSRLELLIPVLERWPPDVTLPLALRAWSAFDRGAENLASYVARHRRESIPLLRGLELHDDSEVASAARWLLDAADAY